MKAEESQIAELFRRKDIDGVCQIINSSGKLTKNMCIIKQLTEIYKTEKKSGRNTILDYSTDTNQLIQHYIQLKLLLRRMDFDMPKKYMTEIYDYIKTNQVSESAIVYIILRNMLDKKKVCTSLIAMYQNFEGKDSPKVQFYQKILQGIQRREADNEPK